MFDEDLIGNDTITDFDVSEDRIVFTSTEFGSFEDLQLANAITYADGTATIDLGEDGTVVLNATSPRTRCRPTTSSSSDLTRPINPVPVREQRQNCHSMA